MRPTVGTGLRFNPGGLENVKVRLDLAFGKDSARLYLSLGDSF